MVPKRTQEKQTKIEDKNIQEKVIIKSETLPDKEAYYAQPYDTAITLTGEQKKELGQDTYDDIYTSINDSSIFFNQINEWERIYENEVEEKTHPWKNCANTSVPIGTVKVDGIVDKTEMTISEVRPNYMITSKILGSKIVEGIKDWLQDILDDKLDFRLFLEGILHNACKQRTGIAILRWIKDITRRRGREVFKTVDKFKEKYPSADYAKVSEDIYNGIIKNLKDNKEETIQIEYNDVKEGPKLEIINRNDFILVPSTARNLKEARGKYFRAWYTWQDFEKGIQQDIYKKKDIDSLKEKFNTTKDGKKEVIHASQNISETTKNTIEGINPLGKEGQECFVGIRKYDINGDGIEEDILITMHYQQKHILRVDAYPYWSGEPFFYAIRIKARVNRFDGVSIIERIAPIKYEIDTQHNQRIDAWTRILAMGLLKKAGVEMIPDPANVTIDPSTIIEIEDENIQSTLLPLFQMPTGLPSFINEENILLKYADDIAGFSTLQSGRESPTDPRAPATKVIALLREANVKIAAYIRHVRRGLNKIGKGILWLYYQFGEKEYTVGEGDNKITFTREDINPEKLHIRLHASEANMNQELLKQEALFLLQTLIPIPMIQQNPLAVKELIQNLVNVVQFPGDKSKLTMTEDEIMQKLQEWIQQQQEAMQQQQAQETDKKLKEITKNLDPEDIKEVVDRVTEEETV